MTSKYLQCPKCLSGGSEHDKRGEGGKCPIHNCDGILAYPPSWDELTVPLSGNHTCGRRWDSFSHSSEEQQPDYWEQFKRNGDRVCSYCGSLHPEDFFRLVKQCAESDEQETYGKAVGIEPSDKGYKIYVCQPGVRNAHEGGIKFYTHHLPENITEEMNQQYREAVRKTRARFTKILNERLPPLD